MDDTIRIAVEALRLRAAELFRDRDRVRRRLLNDAMRDIEIDRDIAGCIAGAKALGEELKLPPRPDSGPQQKQQALQNFLNSRNVISQSYALLKADYCADDDQADEVDEALVDARPEMPRIADIIVEKLSEAGSEGIKAAEIRQFILDRYDADIHDKTVGMTLYRLQKDNQVHRDGRIWFLGPAPGPRADEDAGNGGGGGEAEFRLGGGNA